MRRLGGQSPDREFGVTMNRMHCKSVNGDSWTTAPVRELRELRESLGIAAFDPAAAAETISVDAADHRLEICVASVHRLIRQGALPAAQLLPSAPWKIPVAAIESEAGQAGVRDVIVRRSRNVRTL
jgi:hypothetical protein